MLSRLFLMNLKYKVSHIRLQVGTLSDDILIRTIRKMVPITGRVSS